jgi:hypothetical protein
MTERRGEGWRESLDRQWATKWAQTPPVASTLRRLHPDIWVRFHSLPDSKRWPDTDAEYRTVLSRHYAVLDALGLRSECLVIAPSLGADAAEVSSIDFGDLLGLDEEVETQQWHWRTVASDAHEVPLDLYVFSVGFG